MVRRNLFGSVLIIAPIFLFIIFFLLSVFGQNIFDFEEEVGVSFGFIEVPIMVTENELRVIFGVLAIISLLWTFLRDYSSFYPRLLRMDVGFDNDGIEEIFDKFQKDARFSFDVYSDWKNRKRALYRVIESEILAKVQKSTNFGSGKSVRAKGITTFVVERKTPFSQCYKVIEADGVIEIFEGTTSLSVQTQFHLCDSAYSDIRVPVFDMLFKHTFFVNPMFSQTYKITPVDEIRFENLVACSLVRFFPFVSVGYTLYLMRGKKNWFPIGYCRYEY